MLPFVDDGSNRLLLVKIGKTLGREIDPYQATRGVWRVNRDKAELADLVLGIADGVVVSVYRPVRWKEATREEFPHHPEDPIGRYAFDGVPADSATAARYLGRSLPEHLVGRKGAANPVRYSW